MSVARIRVEPTLDAMETLLITGGAGFLGSHFVKWAIDAGYDKVVNVDLLSYAGDLGRLGSLAHDRRLEFVRADVADREGLDEIFARTSPEVIVHFAAESHVTRSESVPDVFYRTNVEGTRSMLNLAQTHGVSLFVHISTDEVYGPIVEGRFREEDKLPGTDQATSPYAKSKALADDEARRFSEKLPVVIVRPTNAFGPFQYPEKALPRWITRALTGRSIPVWGDGKYVRQWLFAEDLAEAVGLLLGRGEAGSVYNVGPDHEPEITNIDLARWLAEYLGLEIGVVEFTEYDRPLHDRRYAVDAEKIRELGWSAGDVWAQFAATVNWYRDNRKWWEPKVSEAESIYSDNSRQ